MWYKNLDIKKIFHIFAKDMSKKILIKINGRPNLVGLFHSYLSRKCSEKHSSKSMHGIWDDDDYADYYDEIAARWGFDDEDYDILYPSRKRGKKKHKKGSKNKKYLPIDVAYSGEEEYPNEYDGSNSDKMIWFYPTFCEKQDKLEFNTIHDFDEYCELMGYTVPSEVIDDIIYRYESHCCLSPQAKSLGILEIMSEGSYGDLYYEALSEASLVGDYCECDDV